MSRFALSRSVLHADQARTRASVLPLSVAAAAGLAALVAFATTGIRIWQPAAPELPAPTASVEGTLADGTTVETPLGAPVLYGRLEIRREGALLASELVGDPRVTVRTSTGPVPIELPPPESWQSVHVERRTLNVLDRTMAAASDGRPLGTGPFTVTLIAARPGTPIVADAVHPARIWLATRAAVRQAWSAEHSIVLLAYPTLAVLFSLIAIVSLGWAVRRET